MKNAPKNVNPNAMIAVNKTGMWSDEVFKDWMESMIINHSLFEPVLLLIDSYAVHIKAAQSKLYEKHNVFIKIVPPKMTNICQPLDVAINKSFQSCYEDLYNDYIATALNDPALQTKSKNPKVPSYLSVSNWVCNWVSSVRAEMVENAFKICGIGQGSFNFTELHQPLKDLYSSEMSKETWLENYASLASHEDAINLNEIFVPQKSEQSFYVCVHKFMNVTNDFIDWFSQTTTQVVQFIHQTWGNDILDASDEREVLNGVIITGAEIFAVSNIYSINIIIKHIDEDLNVLSQKNYNCEASLTLNLLCSTDLYFINE